MRKQRVRRGTVAATSLIGAAALVLAACSSDGENSGGGAEGEESGSEGGVTTLTFAASTFGDPGRGPGLLGLLSEFNESQDEIEVSAAAIPFPTFGQTVLTQMGSGLGPDLIRFDMP